MSDSASSLSGDSVVDRALHATGTSEVPGSVSPLAVPEAIGAKRVDSGLVAEIS